MAFQLLKSTALVFFLVGLETSQSTMQTSLEETTLAPEHLWICETKWNSILQQWSYINLARLLLQKELTQPSYIPRQRWAARLEYISHRL